jgi:cytochrome c oxidase subunit 2
MSGLILTALVILVFIVIYQIARASEYVNLIRGEEETVSKKTNKTLAWVLLVIFFLGMWGIYECHVHLAPLYLPESASVQGLEYESMLMWTIVITGIAFFGTQLFLFWFSFKYRAREGRKPLFYSHNNKLELIWTTIPALTLMILVAIGLKNWNNMTSKAPEDSLKVQVVGKQFNFIIRYPGKDGVFGKTNFRLINDANNVLGLDWNDPATKDDIIIENGEIHIINERNVQFVINSRDVLHNLSLPHFRMKMDAVPGITTTLWMTPRISTAKMREITKNPEFVYEIPCSEMCGKGHYSMKGTVIVETKAEFEKWLSEQKTYYSMHNGVAEAPKAEMPANAVPSDSSAVAKDTTAVAVK